MKPMANPGSGFTLIEVLVAMVVLGILSTSAFYFISTQNGAGSRNTDMMQGFAFGKQKLDSLKVAPYDSLSSGSDTAEDKFLRSWQITALRGGDGQLNGRKKIDLTVYWPLTAQHNASFATLISDDKFMDKN